LPTAAPNEDFGNPKNILDRLFGHYFKGVSTSFGRLLLENVLKKMVQNWGELPTAGPKCFSGFQNLRLGSINFAR
jgi:hypothetical protein